MTKHSWKSRGVEQWQCKNHREDGKLRCKNEFVNRKNLELGFVKAYNKLMDNADREKWKKMAEEGTPLEKVRGRQMLELVDTGQLSGFVPELAQLVIISVTAYGATKFEFKFMDGSKDKVTI